MALLRASTRFKALRCRRAFSSAMSLTLKIPGSTLLFENARTAVLSLDLAISPIVNVGEALDGIDHVLLHWNGGGSTIRTESSWDDPLRPSQSLASGATATWNAFSSDGATTLQAGSADAIGMQEAALVICKPYTAPGEALGGWPPELPPDDSFVYIPDSASDVDRPRPWSVTTDIAQQVLLENDVVRIWRFELGAGESCHGHQHVYPYFFYNLLPASTRRLEWQGGETPAAGQLTAGQAQPNTASPRKVFWLDTLDGGKRSTHFHGLENHSADAPFRQFIVEFTQGADVQLRASNTTARDPTLPRRAVAARCRVSAREVSSMERETATCRRFGVKRFGRGR